MMSQVFQARFLTENCAEKFTRFMYQFESKQNSAPLNIQKVVCNKGIVKVTLKEPVPLVYMSELNKLGEKAGGLLICEF